MFENKNIKLEENNSLILVDYKSQANQNSVSQETYWNAEYKAGYQRQLDFYVYLLNQLH